MNKLPGIGNGPEARDHGQKYLPLTAHRSPLTGTLRAWLLPIGVLTTLTVLLPPRPALADPHAVFLTDRGQAQVFYNTLAALNQSDYVENPNLPPLDSDRRFGQLIRTGRYEPPLIPRRVTTDALGNLISIFPAPEPAEEVRLPRLRVRQVTSDNGDVFYRERVERRALAEEMRVLFAQLTCRAGETIFGPATTEARRFCQPRPYIIPAPIP